MKCHLLQKKQRLQKDYEMKAYWDSSLIRWGSHLVFLDSPPNLGYPFYPLLLRQKEDWAGEPACSPGDRRFAQHSHHPEGRNMVVGRDHKDNLVSHLSPSDQSLEKWTDHQGVTHNYFGENFGLISIIPSTSDNK